MKRLLVSVLFLGAMITGINATAHSPKQISENTVVWFEIPAVDFDRAVAFYNAILGISMKVDKSVVPMAFLPAANDKAATGAVVKMDHMNPSAEGTVVYLNGGADLQVILDRVIPAGGKILVPKTKISDQVGSFAWFLDSEGNRLGLFSPPQ